MTNDLDEGSLVSSSAKVNLAFVFDQQLNKAVSFAKCCIQNGEALIAVIGVGV